MTPGNLFVFGKIIDSEKKKIVRRRGLIKGKGTTDITEITFTYKTGWTGWNRVERIPYKFGSLRLHVGPNPGSLEWVTKVLDRTSILN